MRQTFDVAVAGGGVVGSAAWVTILFGNELLNGVLAIANDMRGMAT